MSFVLHLMCLYSPQPTAIQNCTWEVMTTLASCDMWPVKATSSHVFWPTWRLWRGSDCSGFVRGRIPRTHCGGPLTNGPSGGGVRYLTTLPFVLCSVRNLLKLGDFVKASDFRDMKCKFIKGILPHNLYLTTVWGLRGVVSQLILVLVVAGCGWSMATSAFGQTPVVWHGSSTVAADHLWCGAGWWAIWGPTSNG